MKQECKPTRRQKELIASKRLNPDNWMVYKTGREVKEDVEMNVLYIRHKHSTKETRKIFF